MRDLLKNYLGFIIGLVFGSSVATVTTYAIVYDPTFIIQTLELQDCLTEKLTNDMPR